MNLPLSGRVRACALALVATAAVTTAIVHAHAAGGTQVITTTTEMHLHDGSVVRSTAPGVVFIPTQSNPAPPTGPAVCTVDARGACQP